PWQDARMRTAADARAVIVLLIKPSLISDRDAGPPLRGGLRGRRPVKRLHRSESANITMNTKKRNLPISADPAAMPPYPKTAAMTATTKNASDQCSMASLLNGIQERGYLRRRS